MRSIGTGQWRNVSKVNQKQEGHTQPKGLLDLFYEHIDYVFRTMNITLCRMCVLLY